MGDKAQIDTRKKSDKIIENLIDSDESVEELECDVCGVTFSSAKEYESHMQGQKHKKRVTEAKLRVKQLAADKEKPESDEESDDDMRCEICDKDFTSYISFVAHQKGSLHAKNLKKQKLKQRLGKLPDVLDQDEDSDWDSILPKPYARCRTCKKEFSGPESYNLHLKSAQHKKKEKQSKAVESLKAEHEDEPKNSDDEEPFSKCVVCQKSFSGIVPYKIHMESAGHKKSLEKQKVAEEVKEFYVEDTGYICGECKKTFSDPVAFKSHQENNSHEKQKVKSALLEFLNDHPEVILVYPFDEEDSKNESNDGGSKYYLICKICNFSFSGPESAQDHVKSKKHREAKREKMMLRLIKEQKKNAAVNASDETAKSDKSSANGTLKSSAAEKAKSNDLDKLSSKETSANSNPRRSSSSNMDDFEMI